MAIDPRSRPQDLVQPGHIFPLKAKRGGVLERTGQTEAAVDLARLAGLNPAGVICEIMNEDGTMARVPDLVPYCERHGLKMITVADLIAYRRRHDKLVERVVEATMPTKFGDFRVVGFRSLVDEKHHVAMVKGDIEERDDVIVRVHSECLTGDVLHSLRCDCGQQLEDALLRIEQEAAACCSTSRRRAAGSGCSTSSAPTSCRRAASTRSTPTRARAARRPARLRHRRADPGGPRPHSIRPHQQPKKIVGLEGWLTVTDQLPIVQEPTEHNVEYLRAKRERMGHKLHHQGLALDEEMIHEERKRP